MLVLPTGGEANANSSQSGRGLQARFWFLARWVTRLAASRPEDSNPVRREALVEGVDRGWRKAPRRGPDQRIAEGDAAERTAEKQRADYNRLVQGVERDVAPLQQGNQQVHGLFSRQPIEMSKCVRCLVQCCLRHAQLRSGLNHLGGPPSHVERIGGEIADEYAGIQKDRHGQLLSSCFLAELLCDGLPNQVVPAF